MRSNQGDFVAFEYSTDPDFNTVPTVSGESHAPNVPVKVEVSDLQPDTQ
ncbi:MAG: hypothetical protein J7641_12285 [Cyanobacteria bacterium SID2]|nr:hypothetical protein [Cyanobacteria bacterium SID2]MBP0006035.1 hypothetical protein [Cyanobacteria bacterium SBC]